MRRVVAWVPDLLDRSRLQAAWAEVELVRDLSALVNAAAGADLVVVDLARPQVLPVLSELVAVGAPVVGFVPHVDSTTAEAAAAAGCEVLPRSRFFRVAGPLLAGEESPSS